MKKTSFTIKNIDQDLKNFYFEKAKETGSNNASFEAIRILKKHANNSKNGKNTAD